MIPAEVVSITTASSKLRSTYVSANRLQTSADCCFRLGDTQLRDERPSRGVRGPGRPRIWYRERVQAGRLVGDQHCDQDQHRPNQLDHQHTSWRVLRWHICNLHYVIIAIHVFSCFFLSISIPHIHISIISMMMKLYLILVTLQWFFQFFLPRRILLLFQWHFF